MKKFLLFLCKFKIHRFQIEHLESVYDVPTRRCKTCDLLEFYNEDTKKWHEFRPHLLSVERRKEIKKLLKIHQHQVKKGRIH